MPIIGVLFLLFLFGCDRHDIPPGPVVAKVNEYSITADEYRSELVIADKINKSFPESAQKTLREGVLDNLIVRQVLLEEAQKQGFDKDPAFMHEVESYWRQALLKALLNKKSAQLLADAHGGNAKVSAQLDRWVKDLISKAHVEKNESEIARVVIVPQEKKEGVNGK